MSYVKMSTKLPFLPRKNLRKMQTCKIKHYQNEFSPWLYADIPYSLDLHIGAVRLGNLAPAEEGWGEEALLNKDKWSFISQTLLSCNSGLKVSVIGSTEHKYFNVFMCTQSKKDDVWLKTSSLDACSQLQTYMNSILAIVQACNIFLKSAFASRHSLTVMLSG